MEIKFFYFISIKRKKASCNTAAITRRHVINNEIEIIFYDKLESIN